MTTPHWRNGLRTRHTVSPDETLRWNGVVLEVVDYDEILSRKFRRAVVEKLVADVDREIMAIDNEIVNGVGNTPGTLYLYPLEPDQIPYVAKLCVPPPQGYWIARSE